MNAKKWCFAAATVMATSAFGSEADALEASEALVRHVLAERIGASRGVCLDAYVKDDVAPLIERLRGAAPNIRAAANCRSDPALKEHLWIRLGFPIKEAAGEFLQSVDHGTSSNCVFALRKVGETWKITPKLACVVA